MEREHNKAKLKIANLLKDYTAQTKQRRESVDLVNQPQRELHDTWLALQRTKTENEKPTSESKETQAEIPTEAIFLWITLSLY